MCTGHGGRQSEEGRTGVTCSLQMLRPPGGPQVRNGTSTTSSRGHRAVCALLKGWRPSREGEMAGLEEGHSGPEEEHSLWFVGACTISVHDVKCSYSGPALRPHRGSLPPTTNTLRV